MANCTSEELKEKSQNQIDYGRTLNKNSRTVKVWKGSLIWQQDNAPGHIQNCKRIAKNNNIKILK